MFLNVCYSCFSSALLNPNLSLLLISEEQNLIIEKHFYLTRKCTLLFKLGGNWTCSNQNFLNIPTFKILFMDILKTHICKMCGNNTCQFKFILFYHILILGDISTFFNLSFSSPLDLEENYMEIFPKKAEEHNLLNVLHWFYYSNFFY